MKRQIGTTILEMVKGDITQQNVDAVVNAANSGLAGGGVDGAIHRVGGPSIMAECRHLGGCPTGQAKATGAGNLSARWVIHAVGPVYDMHGPRAPELLVSAYRSSLEVAVEKGVESIAFPSLSTGAYRYPLTEAAPIALGTIVEFLRSQSHNLQLVRFVLFDEKTLNAYESALRRLNLPEA